MITVYDEFAGFGGSSQGITAVPGTQLVLAANHHPLAVDVHAANFPHADHYCGDIAKADIGRFPRADFFSSSPSCPPWTDARGVKRDFDRSTQGVLFDPATGPRALDPTVARARALMEEVPRYLRAMRLKGTGRPVLAGVVENVVQVRRWAEFGRWRREIEAEGYRTKVIALNSMHVNAPRFGKVAQSRNRFWMGYYLASLGREPDWDKWLRPTVYCPTCDQTVRAMQVFKQPGVDMGVYGIRHGQYVYRCPHSSCRNQVVEPIVAGADTIIDWSLHPGQRIGERVDSKGRPDPLAGPTVARITAGLRRHARPLLTPSGGTWRREAAPLDEPLATRTTRESDGLVVPPFVSLLRGGGSKQAAYPVSGPIPTVSAQGNHHGLVGPPAEALLLAYYSNGPARSVTDPVGTLTTRDRYGLLGPDHEWAGAGVEIADVVKRSTFRMLAGHEIGAAMGFRHDYDVTAVTSKKELVRGFGNAVTPNAMEVLASALIETITGEALEPATNP
ncbi:DNA cytosine methyltransferase [Kutzneria sp. NPDC051319]|uniref:DNA cytosine methyltransferase n=1 Tax=Kutzneria sp. NPDC051319 TaxID=3155047 RepID=UPI0034420D2B